jgi:hypothetical protein
LQRSKIFKVNRLKIVEEMRKLSRKIQEEEVPKEFHHVEKGDEDKTNESHKINNTYADVVKGKMKRVRFEE